MAYTWNQSIFLRCIGWGNASSDRQGQTMRAGHSNGRMCCGSLILASVLISFPWAWFHPAHADMTKTVTPRVSVRTEHTDNVNLSATDKESDLITVASPGISLGLESPMTTLNFDYEAGFSFYRDDSSKDSVRHRGTVSWDQELTRHLSFDLRNSFVRTEDTVVERDAMDAMAEDIRRDRGVTYRNTGEASLAYGFGTEDQVTVGYVDQYVDDRSPDGEDSRGHRGSMGLNKWFGPRYGIGLTTHFERGTFDQQNDFDEYGAGVTATYRWTPTRSYFVGYNYVNHEFDKPSEEDDYQVHSARVGVDIALSPHTDLHLDAGYYYKENESRGSDSGPSYLASLATRAQRTTFSIEGSGGFDQDYFSSDNFGASQYHDIKGSVDHQLFRALSVFLTSGYRWEKFYAQGDQTEKTFQARGGLSYAFWRHFSLSLEGSHRTGDADDPTRDLHENRILLRLSSVYPGRF